MLHKTLTLYLGRKQWGKGYQHFLFSYIVFNRIIPQGHKNCHCMVKSYLFTTQSQLLTTLKQSVFENIVGKGEYAGNQHFLLFLPCFLPFPKQISIFRSCLFYCLQMHSTWMSLRFFFLVVKLSLTLFKSIRC